MTRELLSLCCEGLVILVPVQENSSTSKLIGIPAKTHTTDCKTGGINPFLSLEISPSRAGGNPRRTSIRLGKHMYYNPPLLWEKWFHLWDRQGPCKVSTARQWNLMNKQLTCLSVSHASRAGLASAATTVMGQRDLKAKITQDTHSPGQIGASLGHWGG